MSTLMLYSRCIFYTSEIGQCFWCKQPCCRIDICYEAYLHHDCEAGVNEDLKRLNEKQFGEENRPC